MRLVLPKPFLEANYEKIHYDSFMRFGIFHRLGRDR